MKRITIRTHSNVPAIADETIAFLRLPEYPKPSNGNFQAKKPIEELTPREIEVLQFVAEGKLNKQAASKLCISVKTVEKHRAHLMKKLGIRGIAGLTHYAIYAGIIPCNPQIVME